MASPSTGCAKRALSAWQRCNTLARWHGSFGGWPPALIVFCHTGVAPASSVRQRMRLLEPTPSKRLNEAAGFVFLAAGILSLLSMASYNQHDPSWNTVAGP